MDLSASVITLILVDRTGRKTLMAGSMIIGGLGCLATVFTIMFVEGTVFLSMLQGF